MGDNAILGRTLSWARKTATCSHNRLLVCAAAIGSTAALACQSLLATGSWFVPLFAAALSALPLAALTKHHRSAGGDDGVDELIERIENISTGSDLTARIGDLGGTRADRVARAIDRLLSDLQASIKALEDKTSTLTLAAMNLQTLTSELGGVEDETRSQSSRIAAAAAEIYGDMEAVHDSAQNLHESMSGIGDSIDSVAIAISEVSVSARGTANITQRASQLANSTNDSMTALRRAAQEIGAVVDTIREIAEQTNLLALNATIEAERAGEAGTGFGVVAGEIKELAGQTSEATEDIRRRIANIQRSTGDAVDKIERIDQVVGDIDRSVSEIAQTVDAQRGTTRAIAERLSVTNHAAREVGVTITQSTETTRQVSQRAVMIDAAIQSSASSSQRTQQATMELLVLANEFLTVISRFKVSSSAPHEIDPKAAPTLPPPSFVDSPRA